MNYDELTEHYLEHHDHLVKRVSYRVGGIHNAEDVVQEAYARAMQYYKSFNPERSDLERWFSTILINATKDLKRQERMDGMVADEDVTDTADMTAYTNELLGLVRKEMEHAPPGATDALELYYIWGYTAKEVAEQTDHTHYSVKGLVKRFREYMRSTYGEDLCRGLGG